MRILPLCVAVLGLAAAAAAAAAAAGPDLELENEADAVSFERALDRAAATLPPAPKADPQLEERFAEAMAEPTATITVVKKHPDGTTTTATVVRHGKAAEGGSSGGDESSDDDDSESSDESGGEESSDEGSESAAAAADAAHPGRKHVITTTTTTVTHQIVPLPQATPAETAGSKASEAAAEESKVAKEEKAAEKSEEKAEKKEAHKAAAAVKKDKAEESEAAAEEKAAEQSAEDSAADGHEEAEVPEIKERKAHLKKLTAMLDERSKEYQAENDWLQKASALMVSLHTKSTNVRLHLNAMHAAMTHLNAERTTTAAQLRRLDNELQTKRRIKRLSREMELLLKHAHDAQSQMAQLAAKRENFASRVDQVRGALQELKQQAIAQRAVSNPLGFAGSRNSCDCSKPEETRSCSCM